MTRLRDYRFALVADSHFDEHSRFEECIRIHDWILDDLSGRPPVDAILHAGDLFERRSTPKERLAVARWLTHAAAVAPVVVARGNHDVDDDLMLFRWLRTQHPLYICERPQVHRLADGIVVAVLPWPRRGHFIASGLAGDGSEPLRAVLRELGQAMRVHDGHTNLLLAHTMVRGSRTSSGQPLVGCDFELGLEDLSLVGADAYLLGHIHAGQGWMIEREGGPPAPVVYPGSPRRTAFGEREDKCYCLVTIAADGGVTVERVTTPATPMVDIAGLEEAWGMSAGAAVVAGAEVRLRYDVDADQQDAARRDAELVRERLLAQGAISVKLEPQVTTTVRARAPELALAKTIRDKLRVYWGTKGSTPEPERAHRLLAMAEEMTEGVECNSTASS